MRRGIGRPSIPLHSRKSDCNPLHLIERDLVAGTVIELGRAWPLVRGHRLGVLQRAAGFEIGGDARGAEDIAADPGARAELRGAALDHAPGVDAVHRRGGECAGAAGGGAEEGALATVADAGRFEIGFEIVMRRHLMPLAAFLMQPHPPALALRIIVFDAHGDDRGRCHAGRETRLRHERQAGAELLFEVFSHRYERGATIVTSNLPFDEWTSVFGSQRLTGALLDRLTHHVHILEMNGEGRRAHSKKRVRREKAQTPSETIPRE